MSYKKKIITLAVFLFVTMSIGCDNLAYSGTKGGKTKYQDVKTDVVELTVYYYSDKPPVADVFIKNDEGTYFKEEAFKENKDLIPVSEEIFNKINEWVDEYNIRSWDGYNMTQKNVMDGGGFGLNITLATGETISANGSNAYPEGYRDANKLLKEIIAEANSERGVNLISENEEMSMKLYINDKEIPVKWEENDSVNEIAEEASKNDITVEMSMYSDNEQVGSLGKKYSSSDVQTTTHNGDIVLYNSSNIVVFYGSNSWAYTRLGKMELSEQEVVEMLSNGNVTIKITSVQ